MTPRHDAGVAQGLAGAILRGLDEAEDAVASGRLDDADAIHEFRKAIKRHRALLRLTEPQRGDAAVRERRTAAALAGRLGGARDLTAVLDGLRDLERRKLIRADVAAVRALIEPRRRAAEQRQLDDATRADILAFIAAARAAAEHLDAEVVPLPDLIAQIVAHYRRMRRAAPPDWRTADPDSLHELRKRVVIHRYQMDLLRPLWPRGLDLWISEAQRLRERLGQHQDLEAIARLLVAEPDLLDARRRARLLTALRTRQSELAESAARQHGRLTAEKPSAFAARLRGYAGAPSGGAINGQPRQTDSDAIADRAAPPRGLGRQAGPRSAPS